MSGPPAGGLRLNLLLACATVLRRGLHGALGVILLIIVTVVAGPQYTSIWRTASGSGYCAHPCLCAPPAPLSAGNKGRGVLGCERSWVTTMAGKVLLNPGEWFLVSVDPSVPTGGGLGSVTLPSVSCSFGRSSRCCASVCTLSITTPYSDPFRAGVRQTKHRRR